MQRTANFAQSICVLSGGHEVRVVTPPDCGSEAERLFFSYVECSRCGWKSSDPVPLKPDGDTKWRIEE